jgi:RimJ/RimL family protein N-acetyltransferase
MILREYLKQIQKNNCKLVPVDKSFMKSIKDYKKIYYKENKYNHYYTLVCNNKKIAITGILLRSSPFFQIAIHQDYRGKNILGLCADMIASKHNIKILNSTISKDNEGSIKAHLKAGFKRIPIEKEKELQKTIALNKNQVRLTKTYK